MASVEEPPYLTVGTDVSAKYKGAFCEAKITDVNKHVKLRVLFDGGSGTFLIDDTDLKTGSTLETGTRIEAKHPEKKQQTYVQATITKILDHSRYTVVFDDGDQCVLRRNSLCLKSGKHFAESETLDQLPLTNPEHFGNPVKVGAIEQYSNANKVQLNNHSLNDKPKGKSSPSTATNSSTTSEETKFNINNGELNNNRKRQQPPDFSNDTIKKMKKERNATSNNTNSSNSGRRGVAKGRKRRESINNGSKQAVEIDDISIDSSQDSGNATPIETNVKFELIEVGVKLMVQYGKGKVQNVYEAKVNKIETNSTGKVKYFVHYTGWNNRYDEWITRNRILSIVTEKENGLKDGKSKQSEIAQPTQVGISASLSSSSTGLSTNKEKDKEKVKEKDKEKEKDREKEKEKDREKEKDKDKDRDKDKERERDKEKEKDRERDKDKEKEREVPLKTRRGRQADVIVSSVINNSSNSHVSSSTNLVNISSTTSIAPTTTVTTSTTTSSTPNSSSSAPTVTITKDKEKDVPSKTRRSRQSEHIVPGITSMANHNSSCSTSSSTTSVSSTTTSSVVSTSSSTITPSTTNLKEITPVKSRRSKQSETISNTDPIIHQNSNVPAPPDTPVKEKGKQQDNKGKEKNATLKTRRSARPIRKKELIAACTSSVQTSSSSDDDGKKSVKQINNNSNSSCAGSADELSQDNEINLNTTEPTPNLISQDVKPIPQDSDPTELEKHEKSLDDLTNSNHKLQVTPQGPSKSPTHHVSQTLSNELATPDCIRPKQDLDEKTSSLEQTYGELNNVLTSPNTRPIYKFCENIEESDCDKKISILQERIMALRQTYNSLKTELNDLDRRRKRPRTERMNPETSNCSVACRN